MIGNHSSIAKTGSDVTAQITVGNYTSIGSYVQMHTLHNHACIKYPQLVSTAQLPGYPHPNAEEKIVIGSDVWIGRNAVLLGNITIGDGAIIGAFSVVAKDVPPFAVVVGNPAIIKRYRFSEEQIQRLLEIRWWDFPEEEIQAIKDDLLDIDVFLNKH